MDALIAKRGSATTKHFSSPPIPTSVAPFSRYEVGMSYAEHVDAAVRDVDPGNGRRK
jgi:predicted 2-oxoglutarate/Fe(II)-dependent dioxygenase YbiX